MKLPFLFRPNAMRPFYYFLNVFLLASSLITFYLYEFLDSDVPMYMGSALLIVTILLKALLINRNLRTNYALFADLATILGCALILGVTVSFTGYQLIGDFRLFVWNAVFAFLLIVLLISDVLPKGYRK